jgi:GT2 family glycosyltransferase
MPELSVVIPSYNHAAFIAEAVQSVLGQTHLDLELIVVDDGSGDESLAVLSRFGDTRLRVLAQENRGAHAAINRGLEEARGDYLAVLNSDDVFHPQRFETMLPVLRANPRIGLIASHVEVIDRAGKSLGIKHGYRDLEPWLLERPERSFRATDDLRAVLLTENYLATSSNYLFTRQCYERVGAFRPLRYAHDWDYALRVMHQADIALVPEALVRYRVHGGNTIRENHAAMIFEVCWILAVHLPLATSSSWFTALPPAERTERLLQSMYTFQCQQVLAAMLAQRLADDPTRAEALLEPGNAERTHYLEFIVSRLGARDETTTPTPVGGLARPWLARMALKARRILAAQRALS